MGVRDYKIKGGLEMQTQEKGSVSKVSIRSLEFKNFQPLLLFMNQEASDDATAPQLPVPTQNYHGSWNVLQKNLTPL